MKIAMPFSVSMLIMMFLMVINAYETWKELKQFIQNGQNGRLDNMNVFYIRKDDLVT